MPMVKCPSNCLDGHVYKVGIDKDEPCTLCLGTGVIERDVVCACGKPVFFEKDGFRYCGKDSCLLDLRRAKRELETPSFGTYSRDPFDMGY